MRVLLVEDDPSLAKGLNTALHRAGYTIDWVSDGASADTALLNNAFDLVILDLGLPKMSGIEVLQRLRSRSDSTPLLILSARDSTQDRVVGLDEGADDYLIKPFELEELLARLRVLERRKAGGSRSLLTIGKLKLDLGLMTVEWNGNKIELNRREFMLLRLLAERPEKVMTREDIESTLYGWGEGIESNAIDVYVHHIRKKTSADVIVTVRGVGYKIGLDTQST